MARVIQYYKAALDKMPSSIDRVDAAVLKREYAMVYMNSGERTAIDKSIECLKYAHEIMPADPITAKFLGECLNKKGHYSQAIDILTPFLETLERKTQLNIWPILLQCYRSNQARYKMEIIALRDKMEKNNVPETK